MINHQTETENKIRELVPRLKKFRNGVVFKRKGEVLEILQTYESIPFLQSMHVLNRAKKESHYLEFNFYGKGEIQEFLTPVTLEDVLEALNIKGNFEGVIKNGVIRIAIPNPKKVLLSTESEYLVDIDAFNWEFGKHFDEQSEETKQFIHDLLFSNNSK